mmetsp:Transcript_28641/g.71303  ORF Transcript_28641/g.71303 Transcript_28641/m.71303 type:complete len:265 (-) Transcript_28641:425-1219(-)
MLCAEERMSSFPARRECFTFIPLVKLPLQMRTYASRSRCLGSRFACSLKTKPENSCEVGSTVSASSAMDPSENSSDLASSARGIGGVPISRKESRKSCTPKFVIAEPKKTGVISPRITRAMSSGGISPSRTSTSSRSCAKSSLSASAPSSRGSSRARVSSSSACFPRTPRPKRCTVPSRRSRTPLKRSPQPIGHSSGQQVISNSLSIWSRISKGERAGRSSLLTKVKSGSRRSLATSNSLRVCGSRPFAPSTSITALSAAASVR